MSGFSKHLATSSVEVYLGVIFSHPVCRWHPQQALKSLHGQGNRNIIAFTECLTRQKVSTCINSFVPHNYPRRCYSNTCSENEEKYVSRSWMTCLSNEASRWASADCTPHGLVPEPARLTKALGCTPIWWYWWQSQHRHDNLYLLGWRPITEAWPLSDFLSRGDRFLLTRQVSPAFLCDHERESEGWWVGVKRGADLRQSNGTKLMAHGGPEPATLASLAPSLGKILLIVFYFIKRLKRNLARVWIPHLLPYIYI